VKKSEFTEEQTACALKQAELGTPVAEVRRKMGISDATFYNWRTKYGGLSPSELCRLKQFEEESAKPKRLVADLSLAKFARHMTCGEPPARCCLRPAATRTGLKSAWHTSRGASGPSTTRLSSESSARRCCRTGRT